MPLPILFLSFFFSKFVWRSDAAMQGRSSSSKVLISGRKRKLSTEPVQLSEEPRSAAAMEGRNSSAKVLISGRKRKFSTVPVQLSENPPGSLFPFRKKIIEEETEPDYHEWEDFW
jgi:hypothetical protein